MTTPTPAMHVRKLKTITLTIGAQSIEAQVSNWTLDPGLSVGDRLYGFAPGAEYVDEADPEPTLSLTYFSDYRSAGFSTWCWQHAGETAAFTLDHHPGTAEHVRWTGNLFVTPGPAGGDVRATETTDVEFTVIGEPTFEFVGTTTTTA